MIRAILDYRIIFFVMAGICLVGIAGRLIRYRLYSGFRKESQKIASSENKLIRQIRLKYENAYRASAGVNNCAALVDKYIYEYRFLGMRLHTLKRTIWGAMAVNLLLAAGGSGLAYWQNYGVEELYLYGGIAAGSTALLAAAGYLFRAVYNEKVMYVNIYDYLENTLAFRLKSECEADAEVKAERRRHQAKRKIEQAEEVVGQADLEEGQVAAADDRKFKRKQKKKNAEEDIQQMKKSFDQIAADSSERHKPRHQMTKEEQQAIVEEILREYLS